jgi:hypothetical protein
MNNSPIIGALPNYRYIKGFLPSFPEDFYYVNSYKHPAPPSGGAQELAFRVCLHPFYRLFRFKFLLLLHHSFTA